MVYIAVGNRRIIIAAIYSNISLHDIVLIKLLIYKLIIIICMINVGPGAGGPGGRWATTFFHYIMPGCAMLTMAFY